MSLLFNVLSRFVIAFLPRNILRFSTTSYIKLSPLLCLFCVLVLIIVCACVLDPMDYSLLVSSVPVILQARTPEWLPCPPPGDLSNPGTEPVSPATPAMQGGSLPSEPPGDPFNCYISYQYWLSSAFCPGVCLHIFFFALPYVSIC